MPLKAIRAEPPGKAKIGRVFQVGLTSAEGTVHASSRKRFPSAVGNRRRTRWGVADIGIGVVSGGTVDETPAGVGGGS